ncbi:MAG: hypothetical protein OXG56_04595 [Gammaproteobacteria bacterium]|nr:hypothetical protein [Gammaproteobacteria bacterium]
MINAYMNDATNAGIPTEPPTRFEFPMKPRIPTTGPHQLWKKMSCSSNPRWPEPLSSTVSSVIFSESFADLFRAEKRAASVNTADAPENLFELRRLTGFTWTRLAILLNVTRRTLNNWVKGAKIRNTNHEHIAKTLEVLRFADRGSAELNATVLDEQSTAYEPTPFEAIRTQDYDAAKRYLSHGVSRPHGYGVASWTGEFQPMFFHADADGTEAMEPLPDEPTPISRKRKIKRV